MNCTALDFTTTSTYRHIQIGVLVFLLFGVIANNLLAIYATLMSLSTSKCLLSKLFIISFLSNIMAACSLFGGSLLANGKMIRGCNGGTLDHYFFFYFGTNNNILVLFLNTYLRRKALIASFPEENTLISRLKFILTYNLPFFLTSVILAVISIIVQDHAHPGEMRLEASVTTGIPLMIIVISMNVHLSYFLNERKKISEKLNEQSFRNLETARRVLISVAKWQSFYVVLWIVIIILMYTIAHNDAINAVILLWITRVVFAFGFVLEAKILVFKDKTLRQFLCNKIKKTYSSLFRCGGGYGGKACDVVKNPAADTTSQTSKQTEETTSAAHP